MLLTVPFQSTSVFWSSLLPGCGGLRHRIARLSPLYIFFLWLVLLGAARGCGSGDDLQFEEGGDQSLCEGGVGCELAAI